MFDCAKRMAFDDVYLWNVGQIYRYLIQIA